LKVLITGATGFVGSWLTRALCKRNFQVRILCRNPKAAEEFYNLPIEVVTGDITHPESLNHAFQGVQGVFHLAAIMVKSKNIGETMERVNVNGTRNVLAAALKHNIQRFIHMSSTAAIGASFDGKPLNENSPFKISHLNLSYFETKKAAEKLVQSAVKQEHLNAVIVNPSSIYGPEDAKKGSRTIQVKIAKGKFPFYSSGGVNIIGIEDVVEGTLSAWEKGRIGDRYILSGENITIKDLFKIIATEAKVTPPFIYLPNPVLHALGKVGDFMERRGKKAVINSEKAHVATLYNWFDSSKAQKELGLRPKPIRQAIASSVQWMKDNHVI